MTEKKIQPRQPLSKDEERLLSSVDEHRDELTALLQNLVRIDSRNSSEYEFLDRTKIFTFADNYMRQAGFDTILTPAPFLRGKEDQIYYNLTAFRKGSRPGKTLQFCGHLDTVPFNEDRWNKDTPPLGGIVRDERLYGRGAVDMKAGVASQMLAMKLFIQGGYNFSGKIQMWFTPDEETHGTYGSAFMTEHYRELVEADATIIAEPTSMKPLRSPAIIIGEKGPLWLKLTFHGVAGHGSMPKEKSNALNKAARFIEHAKKGFKIPRTRIPMSPFSFMKSLLSRYPLSDLRQINQRTSPERNPLDKDRIRIKTMFETTYSFNRITAGTKTNVIPDTCELELDCRIMPGLSTQAFFDALAKYCTRLGYRVVLPEGYSNPQEQNGRMASAPVDLHITILSAGEGSFVRGKTDFSDQFEKTFEAVYNTTPVHGFSPGFTDGGILRAAGFRDIHVCGPSGGKAHEANEYADLDSALEITKLYLLLAYRYLAADSPDKEKKEDD